MSKDVPLQFKISEELPPMPTLDSDEEESFIVLGRSLLPESASSAEGAAGESIEFKTIQNAREALEMELLQLSDIPSVSNIFPSSYANDYPISIGAFSSNLSPEEIQNKVELLIQENQQLRNTVVENHKLIKIGLKTMHQDVEKTFEAQKVKFEETKTFVNNLKAEIAHLNLQLEKVTEIKNLQDIEIFKLKDELKMTKHVEGNDNTNEIEDDRVKIENLETDIKKKDRVIEQLTDIIKTNNGADFVDKSDEINKLTEDLRSKEEIIENLTENVRDLTEKINSFSEELKDKDKTIEAFKTKAQIHSIDQENIKSLEKQIRELLNEKFQATAARSEAERELMRLKTSTCLIDEIQDQYNNVKQQLAFAQIRITNLQSENQNAKANPGSTVDMAVVMAQLDQFRKDFEAERNLNQELKRDKDELMRSFLHIQKRNTELYEENDLIKSGRNKAAQSPTAPEAAEALEVRYNCPICSFGFNDYHAVSNHVERCMELQEQLP